MRIKRLLVGAIGAALVVASPLALSTNAQAADDGTAVSAPAADSTATDSSDTAFTPAPPPAARQRAAAANTSRLKLNKQAYSVYRYKQVTKVSGQIQASGDGCPSAWCYVDVAGDSVRLFRRIAGTQTFRQVGIAYGNSEGRFAFKVKSSGNAVYRVVYSGVGSIPGATINRTIRGSRTPGVSVRKSGRKVIMKGNVDPGWGNKRVIVQRKSTKNGRFGNWRSIQTGKYGQFQLRLPGRVGGYYYYRVIVPGTAPRWTKATSTVWRVRTVRY